MSVAKQRFEKIVVRIDDRHVYLAPLGFVSHAVREQEPVRRARGIQVAIRREAPQNPARGAHVTARLFMRDILRVEKTVKVTPKKRRKMTPKS